jgi:hypothetical protein
MAKLRSTLEIVVWSEVLDVLDRKIEDAISAAAEAEGLREMGKAQGRLAAFREMVNLPRTMLVSEGLQTANDEDREAIRRSQDPMTWKHPDLLQRR